MATTDSLKNQLQESNQAPQQVDSSKLGFKSLMSTPSMKKRFSEVLNDRSEQFMSSLMTLVSGDDYLSKAEPMTIIASAMKAATMDLPIDKNLGYAYIVPFNRKEKVGNKVANKVKYQEKTGLYEALKDDVFYKESDLRNKSGWNIKKGQRVYCDKVIKKGKYTRGEVQLGTTKRYFTLRDDYMKLIR